MVDDGLAAIVLFVSRDGRVVAQFGDTPSIDDSELVALAAHAASSVAGEPKEHERSPCSRWNAHIQLAGRRHVLIVLYEHDDLAAVRIAARHAVGGLLW